MINASRQPKYDKDEFVELARDASVFSCRKYDLKHRTAPLKTSCPEKYSQDLICTRKKAPTEWTPPDWATLAYSIVAEARAAAPAAPAEVAQQSVLVLRS